MIIKTWLASLVNRAVALVVAAVLLTALALTVANMWLSQGELGQQSQDQLATLSRLVANELDDRLRRRLDVLSHVASSLSMPAGALRQNARTLLRQQVALSHLFDGLYLVGDDGELLAASPEYSGLVGTNVSYRPYFREVSRQPTPVVSAPFLSAQRQRPTIMVAAPLFDARQRFIGMIGGTIVLSGDNLIRDIAGVHLGQSGYLEVVTRAGIRVMNGTGDAPLGRVDTGNALIREAMAGFEGTRNGRSENGEPSLLSVQQMAQVPWFVMGVWPTREALAPLSRIGDAFVWLLLAVVAVMIPLSLWAFGRLLSPLRRLGRQIRDLHEGRRQTAVDIAGGTEIRLVADLFNRLIAERAEVFERLRQEQEMAEGILGALQEGVLLVDVDGGIRYANDAACRFLGSEVDCRSGDFFTKIEVKTDAGTWSRDAFLASDELDSVYCTVRNWAGETYDIDLTMLHLRRGTPDERMVFVLRDDSDRRRAEERLSWEATHDALTQLANRRAFTAALVKALGEAGGQPVPTVLMMIDLDHFKPVNDLGGHLLGDDLLRRLADRFREAVRSSDVVARLGGDEFGILLPACGLARAEQLAERLRADVEALVLEQDGRRFSVTASIGVTDVRATDAEPRAVVARADEAAYAAKAGGRNRVVVSSPAMPMA
ncbi:sensor domain-containing diguanylate cyclase [Marinobacter sp. C2H3]|uniref:sensor domain-containing diguanylate cyclase n=1 Tax=Marinobacter sp. C2H3 TaxID=3119003 RepID=UPI00300EDDD4